MLDTDCDKQSLVHNASVMSTVSMWDILYNALCLVTILNICVLQKDRASQKYVFRNNFGSFYISPKPQNTSMLSH